MNTLSQDLIALAADCLGVDPLALSVDADLEDLGMDSISMNEFALHIEDRFGIEVDAALFFDLRTVSRISNFLTVSFPETINAHYPTPIR